MFEKPRMRTEAELRRDWSKSRPGLTAKQLAGTNIGVIRRLTPYTRAEEKYVELQGANDREVQMQNRSQEEILEDDATELRERRRIEHENNQRRPIMIIVWGFFALITLYAFFSG